MIAFSVKGFSAEARFVPIVIDAITADDAAALYAYRAHNCERLEVTNIYTQEVTKYTKAEADAFGQKRYAEESK